MFPSFQSKLINNKWKSTAFKEDGDTYSKWCWKNSVYNFYENGDVYITEGDNENACFGNVVGRIKKYKYNIINDEKTLVINYQPGIPDEIDSFSIVSLSGNKLYLKRIVNKIDMPPGNIWEDELTLIP